MKLKDPGGWRPALCPPSFFPPVGCRKSPGVLLSHEGRIIGGVLSGSSVLLTCVSWPNAGATLLILSIIELKNIISVFKVNKMLLVWVIKRPPEASMLNVASLIPLTFCPRDSGLVNLVWIDLRLSILFNAFDWNTWFCCKSYSSV